MKNRTENAVIFLSDLNPVIFIMINFLLSYFFQQSANIIFKFSNYVMID